MDSFILTISWQTKEVPLTYTSINYDTTYEEQKYINNNNNNKGEWEKERRRIEEIGVNKKAKIIVRMCGPISTCGCQRFVPAPYSPPILINHLIVNENIFFPFAYYYNNSTSQL